MNLEETIERLDHIVRTCDNADPVALANALTLLQAQREARDMLGECDLTYSRLSTVDAIQGAFVLLGGVLKADDLNA